MDKRRGIDDLRKALEMMGGEVFEMFSIVMSDFRSPSSKEDVIVIEKDKRVNDIKLETDRLVSTLIALQQPVASDLRIVIGAMKISTDIERIGDHIVLISKSLNGLRKVLGRDKMKKKLEHFRYSEYAEAVSRVFQGSLGSFNESNTLMARGVCNSRDELFVVSKKMMKELMSQMSKGKVSLKAGLLFVQILKDMDRVVSLSVNIAEDVVYIYGVDLME